MITIENMWVRLPGFTLQDISLKLMSGEFFSLLGPTGAGKTLIIESIAGLVSLHSGRMMIEDRDVSHLPPEKRGVGIVYQDHALFPHLNVSANITYGLRYHRKRNPKKPPGQSIDALIERLGLTHLIDRSIHNLSGGERQRVALARALAIDPSVLLLDEPLSSLDPNFREEIRQLLKELHRETGITVLMVTHDFSEAHFLAERVAVINAGRIEQIDTVSNVFLKPNTPFTANFVGMKNLFPAVFQNNSAIIGNDLTFVLDYTAEKRAYLAIRPEHIELSATPPQTNHPNQFKGVITRISNQGVYSDLVVDVSGHPFQVIATNSKLHAMQLDYGSCVFISVPPHSIHTL